MVFAKCPGRRTLPFMSVNNRGGKNRPEPIGCTLALANATQLSPAPSVSVIMFTDR